MNKIKIEKIKFITSIYGGGRKTCKERSKKRGRRRKRRK